MSAERDGLVRLHEHLLRLYPRAFRARFGTGMRHVFRQELEEARGSGPVAVTRLLLRTGAQHLALGLVERGRAVLGRGGEGGWGRDLRHGLRRLRRAPGFTGAALVSLALGIGGTAAMFTLVKGVVLNPLPYPEADRLVAVQHRADGAGLPLMGVSLGTYVHYRELNQTLDDITLYQEGAVSVVGVDSPLRVPGVRVGSGFFVLLLDAPPILGRTIAEADQRPGAPLVAVIGAALWQSRFGGDPGIIGRAVSIDGRPTEIVGVLPPGFDVPSDETQVWLPHQIDPERVILGGFGRAGIARLRDGISPERAQADLESLVPGLEARFNPAAFDLLVTGGGLTPLVRPLKETVVGSTRQTLWVLLGTVLLVLAIAAANVANLFLVRAESQRQEVEIRAALGAGRGAIVRHHLSEALVLGLLAGTLGLVGAWATVRWVVRTGPEALPRLHEIGLEPLTVVLTYGLAAVCGLGIGLLPLVRRGAAAGPTLARAGRGTTAGLSRWGLRNGLVSVQVALALMLLVGSGLLVRTYWAVRSVDAGFQSGSALVFQVGLPRALVPDPTDALRMQQDIVAAVGRLPGVEAVGAGVCLPLTGCRNDTPVYADDQPVVEGQTPPSVDVLGVTAGYLEALGVPVVEGRTFDLDDPFRDPHAAVISHALAERLWPGRSALGRRIHPDLPHDEPYTVVGVVGDIRSHELVDPPPETLYLSFLGPYAYSAPPHTLGFVVHTGVPPASLAAAVREAVREQAPDVPVANLGTLGDVMDEARAPTAFAMVLLSGAGLVAVVLGCVGIYGVVSYTVSRRTPEIGVRMAMGAEAREVRGMVLRQASLFVAVGLAVGLVGAAALTRVLDVVLFGVEPFDPPTFAVGAVALGLVATIATWIPARRAAAVDPATSLREGGR